ncbi:MAG: hypothetical protein QNL93_08535 [Opitutae bacterium]
MKKRRFIGLYFHLLCENLAPQLQPLGPRLKEGFCVQGSYKSRPNSEQHSYRPNRANCFFHPI